MKINIVTGFFLPVPPLQGGATEKIWDRLSRQFVRRGHEVTFISRQWPGFADRETIAGVHHRRVRGASHTRSLVRNLCLDFWWGRRVMRELPPADVTVCNTVMLPIWLRRRRPDAGKVVSVMARMPKGQARLYGGVDLVLSLSTAVTAALQRENPALASRIVPFPFPIDFQLHADAACKRTLLDDAAAVQIGYVGRIHPEKGIDLLLEAAALLAERRLPRPWRLDLTGPIAIAAGGAGLEYRDRLLARHGPVLGNRLHFHEPEFDPVRLAGVYANTDVFCYPSVAEAGETFGVAVAEAMAARCAVVVSALDCFRDLVTDGATGLVFDHRGTTPASNLAERLSRLVQDSSLRSRLGLAAQEHVRCFDYEAVCTSVLGDLERIVSA